MEFLPLLSQYSLVRLSHILMSVTNGNYPKPKYGGDIMARKISELRKEKIDLSIYLEEGFETDVDLKKVQLALSVICEQDNFTSREVEDACEIINERVAQYDIRYKIVDMSNEGYDPFDLYGIEFDEDEIDEFDEEYSY